MEGNDNNHIKGVYQKTSKNIVLNGKMWNPFADARIKESFV